MVWQLLYFILLINNQFSDNNLFTSNQQMLGQAARLPEVIRFPPLEETGFPSTADFYAFLENMEKHENKRIPLPNFKSERRFHVYTRLSKGGCRQTTSGGIVQEFTPCNWSLI